MESIQVVERASLLGIKQCEQCAVDAPFIIYAINLHCYYPIGHVVEVMGSIIKMIFIIRLIITIFHYSPICLEIFQLNKEHYNTFKHVHRWNNPGHTTGSVL